MRHFFAIALVTVAAALPAQDKKPDADGFKPLFNGKNLDGWVNVNCHPDTFFVKGDEIVTTGTPTGFLRTDKQYENFELEMDWMHVEKTKMANSGLFVWGDPIPAVGTQYTRGIEVQVLANAEVKDSYTSDGDIFSIWGATCKPDRPHPKGAQRCLPSEKRTRPAGEWNHYKVIANDGVIKLHVNGKEVSGVSQCNPRKGYLALESEGAECHFKNIKIKELPSTNPKPEEVARVWEGHVSLFNGVDLKGWKTEEGAWKAGGGVLRAAGDKPLVTEGKFDRFELIYDWKMPAKSEAAFRVEVGGGVAVSVHPPGSLSVGWSDGTKGEAVLDDYKGIKPGAWNRMVVSYDGNTLLVAANGQREFSKAPFKGLLSGPVIFKPAEGLEIMNVFVRELKEKK